jgi:hypothetical protein
MKKLSLNMESLTVQSFEAGGAADLRGTVKGAQDTHTCRISCPYCTGPYCGGGDPSYPNGCSLPDCGTRQDEELYPIYQ